ncbi:MAG TPA: cell division protein FtsA [Caulobacteraceae bacterium]|jgi:cell division protein FtsA|nr:cell division protein FtsA [Caulobacteraceae bacterium]
MADVLDRRSDVLHSGKRTGREGLKLPLGRSPVIAAVDLGSSKAACFILKPDGVKRGERSLVTAGVGYVQSRGVRGGAIVDMDAAAQSIGQAVERAESMAGLDVHGITVTTSLGQIASHRVSARVALSGRPINENDQARAVHQAMSSLNLTRRQPIHLRPISWTIDNQRHVQDPTAMSGRTLGLDLVVVSMSEVVWQTLANCVERAHLQFEGVMASPYASALAALEEDEIELGAICIDMGGGSTSAAVFSGGALAYVDSLPVGGSHVTQDIARGLSTTVVGAERIKTFYGSAIASANEDREMIEAPPRGDDPAAGPVTAPRSMLKGIIAPRVEETLELLRDRLKAAGVLNDSGAGLVIVGGASQLAGVREVAVRVFDRQARLGRPRRLPNLADAAAGPAFSAAAGVLQRAVFGPKEAVPRRLANGRAPVPVDPNANVVVRAAAWLRENL